MACRREVQGKKVRVVVVMAGGPARRGARGPSVLGRGVADEGLQWLCLVVTKVVQAWRGRGWWRWQWVASGSSSSFGA